MTDTSRDEKMDGGVILLVDDEELMLQMLKAGLKREGYCVLTASGGNEAFEIVRDRDVDFVLSDMQMPGAGDGLSLLKCISEMTSKKPVVALFTGHAEVTEDAVKELGGIALLNKPLTLKTVRALIKDHIAT